jgi:CRP/FNR family transcriptional regulator, cyclic AMP receptor protein
MTSAKSDLLIGLTPEEGSEFLALGSNRHIRTGETLFRLGDQADDLFTMVRGRLKLTLPVQIRGHEEDVLVEERTPGQTVGWSALIPPYRFTLTATAVIDTEVIALPRELVRQHLASHPDAGQKFALNLAGLIGQRLQIFQAMWVREMQHLVELRCA